LGEVCVSAPAGDAANRPAVAIAPLVLDSGVTLVAQIRKRLLGALPERLGLLRGVDLGQADLYGFGAAAGRYGVAI